MLLYRRHHGLSGASKLIKKAVRKMTPLTTIEDIKHAVRSGKPVFWKNSPVVETRSRNLLVNTPSNKGKYYSHPLAKVIATHGVNDFYHNGEVS